MDNPLRLPKEFFTHRYKRDTSHKEVIKGEVTINLSSELEETLGPAGKMLSPSKSNYRERNPDNEVFFNACIFDADGTQVWFGDLDLTKDTEKLKLVAKKAGKIFVTPETPFRFDGLKKSMKQTYDAERVKVFK